MAIAGALAYGNPVVHMLAHLDFLDEAIVSLGEAIEGELRPFAAQVELLQTIPGVGRRTAEVLVAEIGVDMAQFGSAQRLASWAGIAHGNDQSAGKRRPGRTTKGSKWLRRTLTESALAATRTKDTYPSPPNTAGSKHVEATNARSSR